MKTLLLLGAGALAMYLMDRELGPQRRAQLREQLERAKRLVSERTHGAARAEPDAEHASQVYPGAGPIGR
ncbi:MAG TPA: hypothetical protein VFZ94_09975 [Burkholderiales bacterium]